MKQFCLLFAILILLGCVFCACAANNTLNAMDYTVSPPTVTIPLSTDLTKPTESTEPTESPVPTIPSIYELSGYRFECYYSEQYDDYLNYYIHVPENASENMPLVVYLHGDGEVNSPEHLLSNGLSDLVKIAYGEEFPFILLEPNTRIKSWTSGDIPELLVELIDCIAQIYSTNPKKIIITGYSRGAMGVWDLISTYGNYFSAAVPVSSPHQRDHIHYLKAAEVPVWTFAGDLGDTELWYHDFLEKNVEMIMVSGGYGKFTVLKDCTHTGARVAAYVKETFEWMIAQERGVIPQEE